MLMQAQIFEKRKTYPDGIIAKDKLPDSKISPAYFDKVTFHKLVETVKSIAKVKVSDEDLNKVEHFHDIRNTVYHQGKKTIPSTRL